MDGCLNKSYVIQLQPPRFFLGVFINGNKHESCADSKYDFKGFLRILY